MGADPGGREGEGLRPPAGDSVDVLLVVDQAFSLALARRFADALRLIDETARGQTVDKPPALLFLAKARLLLVRGTPADRDEAVSVLERLTRATGRVASLAQVELARFARATGRLDEARATLEAALAALPAPVSAKRPSALQQVIAFELSALERVPRAPEGLAGCRGGDITPSGPSLMRMLELGRTLAAQVDPQEVLRIVLHEAIEVSGAERGFVAVRRHDELEFPVAENLDWSTVPEPQSQVSRTLIAEVLRTGHPLYLGIGSLGDHPAERSLIDHGVRFAACLPISDTGATIGALYFDSPSRSPALGADRVQLLQLLTAQAGAALRNAWRHRDRDRRLEVARAAIRRHRTDSERRSALGGLVGASEAMQAVYRQFDRIIGNEFPVLILGETGTGKELVARLIHERGPRRDGEFVIVNCGGVPDSLLEDELFGHERGAFSGADRARPGLFELAHRGTLFLDEVGEMSPHMQAALLRAIESGEVRRLGGKDPLRLDVRIIAATHQDLERNAADGRFRSDLLFRLKVLTLRLPPLRERPDDIPLLVEELLRRLTGDPVTPRFTIAARRALMCRRWPGNVRELENVLKQLVVRGVPVVDACDLPAELGLGHAASGGTLRDIEEQAIRDALQQARGNRTVAARLLGIDRRTLYAKLHRGT